MSITTNRFSRLNVEFQDTPYPWHMRFYWPLVLQVLAQVVLYIIAWMPAQPWQVAGMVAFWVTSDVWLFVQICRGRRFHRNLNQVRASVRQLNAARDNFRNN